MLSILPAHLANGVLGRRIYNSAEPRSPFMDKRDWKKYRINTKDGIKLVSDLNEKQAKTELCLAIELLEQLTELNQKGLDLLK